MWRSKTRAASCFVSLLVVFILKRRFAYRPCFAASALVPPNPAEQTKRAIRSIRNTVEAARAASYPPRLFVDYLIPIPPETVAADIDPWPGGLAQMYPYAEDILKDILAGIVESGGSGDSNDGVGKCSSQVISAPDCCGFFIQESSVSPAKDVAALLFPSVDQLDKIAEIDKMVGERTLLIFNRQFQRPVDFGFLQRQRSEAIVFNKFRWGFALQELSCRGEDVKLVYEHPIGWQSCVLCEEDVDMGPREFGLLKPTMDRPSYEELEKKVNEVLPQPLWMRKMGEAEAKGLKFQRERKEVE